MFAVFTADAGMAAFAGMATQFCTEKLQVLVVATAGVPESLQTSLIVFCEPDAHPPVGA